MGGTVPTGEDRCPAVLLGGLRCHIEFVGDVDRAVGQQPAAAGDDRMTGHDRLHAESLDAAEIRRVRQDADPFPCPAGDRPGDRMLGGVLDRADQPQHLIGVDTGGRHQVDQAHPPGGHRSGLVQDDGVHPPGRFQHLRPLDQNPELGGPTATDKQGGGRREAERARAGDDQYGDGGGECGRRPVTECEPHREGGDSEDDHHRDEHRRDPIGEPRDRGLPALRRHDQRRHLRKLGVPTHPGRPDHQPTAGVQRGAGDRVARADLDR